MINRRLIGLGIAVLLVVSACANEQLGRALPVCEGDLSGTMIIQIQSVPSAEYVPCINELRLGWEYVDLVPKLGDSRFSIDSDRSGDGFLEVILADSCQVDTSNESFEVLPGVLQYRDVAIVSTTALVVMAPSSDRELAYAKIVEELLEAQEVEERRVIVTYDERDLSLADKIADAHEAGRPLVAIEQRDELNVPQTAGLSLPGELALRPAVALDELASRLDDFLDKPSYKGEWTTVFDGGCITYLFDAEGPEVETLIQDVTASFGFFPSGVVQRQLRDAGFLG